MSITTIYDPDEQQLTMQLPQQFVFNSYREFRNAYQNMQPETRLVRLDLKSTEYLDSAALGMLMLLHEHCTDSNRKLELVNLSDYVKRLLNATRMDRHFDLELSDG